MPCLGIAASPFRYQTDRLRRVLDARDRVTVESRRIVRLCGLGVKDRTHCIEAP